MDVSSFYKEVFEYTLGLEVLGLENRFRELADLINDKTLVTFSNYIPCLYTTRLDLNDKNAYVREEYGRIGREYHIHDATMDKFNLKIMDLLDVEFSSGSALDPESEYYYSSVMVSRHNIDLMSMLMGAESTYTRTLIDSSIPYKRYEEYQRTHNFQQRNTCCFHSKQLKAFCKISKSNEGRQQDSQRQ